ncbi:hypothetical protein BDW74DRAFT_171658 [Aspergillus multicolor]|uniref:type III PLP-dependent enzyme n=1 Tax=Aspergillus multicolor TaxID=41759 RepID=UPI003CCD6BEF
MKHNLSLPSERDRSEPSCVLDLGYVYRQYRRWRSLLPDVKPFYAVKCNPDVKVIQLLASLGAGFDCSSRSEIDLVLSQGVPPQEIIFANPCKKASDLVFAHRSEVKWVTFDNDAELHKIKRCLPDAQLVLRCAASDPSAMYSMSAKFGASPRTSFDLLRTAKSLDLPVVGVSFHIGSGAKDSMAFDIAIQDSRTVFDAGVDAGHSMRLLDIGGGFSSDSFDAMARTIRSSLDTHFGGLDIEFIAEPGRYFVQGAMTLATEVISRRDASENESDKERRHMLYLNDGIWGSFSSNLFESGPQPRVLCASGRFYPAVNTNDMHKYTLWGPTCDETDCVLKSVDLPGSLGPGDWLYFPNMGAYSTCLTTRFNGFDSARKVVYVSSDPAAEGHTKVL